MTYGSGPGRVYGRGVRTDEYPQRRRSTPPTAEPVRPPRRGRGFALIALAVALLGAGVVATYLLTGLPGARGADTPDQAVDGFLAGVFDAQDARAAGNFVCESARDDAELDQIVLQVSQRAEAYPGAHTTWRYPSIAPQGRQAAAEVTLTMTTANEQVASRVVTLLLVDDGGWWVCDIRTG